MQLLHDIRTIFDNQGAVAVVAAELLTDLRGIPDSPWQVLGRDGKGLDSRGLAKYLRRYEIKSKNIRYMGRIVKGFERGQFIDAWERYPAPPDDDPVPQAEKSATSATSATAQVNRGEDVLLTAATHPLHQPSYPLHRRSRAS